MIYTGCNQRIPEYHSWVSLCTGMWIRSYVELGCGSAHFIAIAADRNDQPIPKVVTVDVLPNGLGGGNTTHVQADTQHPATVQLVLGVLGESPECVFIDADHSYEGVQRDFNLWYPVATRLVGFHDVLMPGVREFWAEISLKYPSVEIIGKDIDSANKWQHGGGPYLDGHVNCGGIGVIFKEAM